MMEHNQETRSFHSFACHGRCMSHVHSQLRLIISRLPCQWFPDARSSSLQTANEAGLCDGIGNEVKTAVRWGSTECISMHFWTGAVTSTCYLSNCGASLSSRERFTTVEMSLSYPNPLGRKIMLNTGGLGLDTSQVLSFSSHIMLIGFSTDVPMSPLGCTVWLQS